MFIKFHSFLHEIYELSLFLFSLLYTLSLNLGVYTTDTNGIKISIPTTPSNCADRSAKAPTYMGRQTDWNFHNFRINEISLDLLKHEKHNDKNQCLQRIDHQNEERSYNTADKSPKYRNKRCKCHEHTDQKRIRHLEKAHRHKNHRPENKRLKTLSRQKIRKCFGSQCTHFQTSFFPFFFQKRMHTFLHIAESSF